MNDKETLKIINKIITFLSFDNNILPDMYDVNAIISHENDEKIEYKYKIHWLDYFVE